MAPLGLTVTVVMLLGTVCALEAAVLLAVTVTVDAAPTVPPGDVKLGIGVGRTLGATFGLLWTMGCDGLEAEMVTPDVSPATLLTTEVGIFADAPLGVDYTPGADCGESPFPGAAPPTGAKVEIIVLPPAVKVVINVTVDGLPPFAEDPPLDMADEV